MGYSIKNWDSNRVTLSRVFSTQHSLEGYLATVEGQNRVFMYHHRGGLQECGEILTENIRR